MRWTIRPASSKARKQWDEALKQSPEVMAKEKTRLETNPTDKTNPRRTSRLQGQYKNRRVGEKVLEQWQQEITSSGRVCYCPDRKTRTVWITAVSLNYPKETD